MSWKSFTGIMARRLLVNWRIPLDIAARVLPSGHHNLRPKSVGGFAIAGLCLVRLESMRLAALPAVLGLTSENLAIRMGVEWDAPEGARGAVLIFRRETASAMTSLVAPRLGYGTQRFSRIDVTDDRHLTRITCQADDGHLAHAHVAATPARDESVFQNIAHAESYFRGGERGYSPSRHAGLWQGASLRMHRWELKQLNIQSASSTYIDMLFCGAAQIDSAFVMRDIPHTWNPCSAQRFGSVRYASAPDNSHALAA